MSKCQWFDSFSAATVSNLQGTFRRDNHPVHGPECSSSTDQARAALVWSDLNEQR